MRGSWANSFAAGLAGLASACAPLPSPGEEERSRYAVLIDEAEPALAQVRLVLPSGASRLAPSRDGDGSGIGPLRCADGRALERSGASWSIPPGCGEVRWSVSLDPIDGAGIDASLPTAAFSRQGRFWLLPERDGLLRANAEGGSVSLRLQLADGRTVERRYIYPSNGQPPFYALIGPAPSTVYRRNGMALHVYGIPPAYPWMDRIHADVLDTWARWRSDLASGASPARIDWAWVRPPDGLEPGYSGSAGNEAIVSQIRLRDGDPDAEAKARAVIATSAAHEGFHTITGAAGQAWPAWVNESLANHFAIEAARRFLPASDFRFIEQFYIAPDVRVPLLQAQSAYASGDGDQAQVFYIHGARFWRAVEQVLVNEPNGSGRLAALIKRTANFAGTDLIDSAALAALLDRHSSGRAGPIVRCYLDGIGCDTR